MPDASGERNGFFAVTLCSPGGASTLLMNLGGPDEPASSGGHAGTDCSFALVVSHAVFPGAELSIQPGLVAQRPLLISLRNQALPPLPALGPPLGSRAPPLNLG